jgi:hypothetical protein
MVSTDSCLDRRSRQWQRGSIARDAGEAVRRFQAAAVARWRGAPATVERLVHRRATGGNGSICCAYARRVDLRYG